MHGEDLLVNDGRDGEAVETVSKGLPELDVVSSLALVVEAVDTVDRGTLVVTAQNEEILGILDLVGEQQTDGFQGLLATIHVVTQEQVVCLGREATVLEQTQEIIVLAVNVTANLSSIEINR